MEYPEPTTDLNSWESILEDFETVKAWESDPQDYNFEDSEV